MFPSFIDTCFSSLCFLLVGLYIVLPPKEPQAQPDTLLLAFAPSLDQTAFNAENHQKFLLATMMSYNLNVDNLVCLIGDNCSTNMATANRMKVPLLGCRSHRFNLVVEAYINQNLKTEVDLVTKLMSKLSTLKEAGRLRRKTLLRPVRRNVTRWLGVINMFERFERLKSNIDTTPQSGLAEFMPSVLQKNNMDAHQKALNDFKAVTLTLMMKILDTFNLMKIHQAK